MGAFGRSLLFGIALGVACPALPAAACTLVRYKPSNYRIDTRAMPAEMVARATTVDLAVAESVDRSAMRSHFDAEEGIALAAATSDADRAEIRADYAAYRDQWERSGAGAVTYRVVERLKGASGETFSLNGIVPLEVDPAFAADLKRYVAQRGAYLDPKATWAMRVRDLDEWGGLGSCASPVFANLGGHYLIFRDERGRLLTDGVPYLAKVDGQFKSLTRDGPVYEPVLLDGDPWLEAVRAAAQQP